MLGEVVVMTFITTLLYLVAASRVAAWLSDCMRAYNSMDWFLCGVLGLVWPLVGVAWLIAKGAEWSQEFWID